MSAVFNAPARHYLYRENEIAVNNCYTGRYNCNNIRDGERHNESRLVPRETNYARKWYVFRVRLHFRGIVERNEREDSRVRKAQKRNCSWSQSLYANFSCQPPDAFYADKFPSTLIFYEHLNHARSLKIARLLLEVCSFAIKGNKLAL